MKIWAIHSDTGIHFTHTVTEYCKVDLVLTHRNPAPPYVYPIATADDLVKVLDSLGQHGNICPECSKLFFARLQERPS